MNHKIKIIIICFFVAAFYSCKDDETVTLNVSKEEFVIEKSGLDENGNSIAFEVNSSKGWVLTHPSWLTPSAISGVAGETRITVSAATNTVDREGFITIQNGRVRSVIAVTQLVELIPSTLTVTPAAITVEFDGKTTAGSQPTVKISTNKSWSITGLPTWITEVNPSSGNAGPDITLYLTVSPNPAATVRDDNFRINAGTRTETVAVTQSAEDIQFTVAPMTIAVETDGTTTEGLEPKITITSSRTWSITSYPDWITTSLTSGEAGATDVTLTIVPNELAVPKNGKMVIQSGFRSETVEVSQKANEPPLTIPTNYIEVDADGKISGNSPTVTFTATKDWNIDGLPAWITANPTSGIAGEHTITLTVQATDLPRKGRFNINSAGISEVITVNQAMKSSLTSFPMTFGNLTKVTITERDGYLEFFMLDRNPDLYDPSVVGTIQGVASAPANFVLTFEYQIDYDPADLWETGPMAALFDTEGAIFAWRSFPAYKVTGIDPSNHALWETYSVTFEPYTGTVRFNFRIAEARLLIKNLKVIVL